MLKYAVKYISINPIFMFLTFTTSTTTITTKSMKNSMKMEKIDLCDCELELYWVWRQQQKRQKLHCFITVTLGKSFNMADHLYSFHELLTHNLYAHKQTHT